MIQVLMNYGGRLTEEKRIEPGVYDEGDPALFGLDDYLVKMGVAQVVGGSRPGRKSTRLAPKDDEKTED